MNENDGLSILIVDDDRLFADAARLVLQENGVERVAVISDPEAALLATRTQQPDAVLLEIDRADGRGRALLLELLSQPVAGKVAVFTRAPERAIQPGRMHPHGVIDKACPPDQLLPTLMKVVNGEVVIPEESSGRELGSGDVLAALLQEQLTKREKQMLRLLMEGQSSQEIATQLALTQNTVRTHIQSLLKKLQVHSRVEAAALAAKHQLV